MLRGCDFHSTPDGSSDAGRESRQPGSGTLALRRKGIAESRRQPRAAGPLSQAAAGNHRVGVARRTRLLHRLLSKCGGIIQLPEGRPGFGAKMQALGKKQAKPDARGEIELVAEVETAGVRRSTARDRQAAAETDERCQPMPALSTGHVQLQGEIDKRD